MRFCRVPFLLAFAIVLSGCSLGGIVDYRKAAPKLTPAKSSHAIAVVGVDDREYLWRGQIKPTYVGMLHDAMGIPWSFHTKNREPLVDQLADSVANGLVEAGYKASALKNPDPGNRRAALAVLQDSKASRWVIVTTELFENHTLFRTDLEYAVWIEVLDRQGRVLAKASKTEVAELPGVRIIGYGVTIRALQTKTSAVLTELLDSPQIRKNL